MENLRVTSEVKNQEVLRCDFYLPRNTKKNWRLIRSTFQTLLENHLNVLTKDIGSQEELLKELGVSVVQNAPKKGKWAHVAEELSTKDILPHEADEILEEGRKWRKGFSIPRERFDIHLEEK